MKPELPIDEAARIDALRRYRILDTMGEQAYDDLTLLASYIAEAPMSVISLVDSERQWFKSKIGVNYSQTPREAAFCAQAILKQDESLYVKDALADKRFADNPQVTGEPKIRFYYGAPLVSPDHHAIGALCVMDRVPRELKPEQITALNALSRQVVAQLELRRQAYDLQHAAAALQVYMNQLEKYQKDLETANEKLKNKSMLDGLTGLNNRAAFDQRLEEEIFRASRYKAPLSLLMVDIDKFKTLNDAHGHQAGDEALKIIAQNLQCVRPSDFVARYGGEEFAIILPATDTESAHVLAERIRKAIESAAIPHGPLTVSIGVSTPDIESLNNAALIHSADMALYQAKQAGRNRIVHAKDIAS